MECLYLLRGADGNVTRLVRLVNTKGEMSEGREIGTLLNLDDLCAGSNVFVAATGVSDGELLKGVRYSSSGAITDSIVMRSASGTVRRIEAKHDFTRLRKLAGTRY